MSDPVALMSCHFVALVCDYETINANGIVETVDTAVYSGFLIELHGVTFWVTAGHCLKDELDASIASGKLRITGGSFMDYFGLEATHHYAIPFRYELGCSYYVEQPQHGLDFAIIMLNDLQVKAFLVNKVIPITRNNWVHQPRLKFDFYRMLGIPTFRVVKTVLPNGNRDLKVGQAMIAVNKISPDELGEPPPGVDVPSDSWFIGRLDADCNISDIAGMSGGPIFGFRRDAARHLVYHVVALQSRWWWKSRTIFGCSMTVFAEEVYQQLGEFFSALENEPDGRE